MNERKVEPSRELWEGNRKEGIGSVQNHEVNRKAIYCRGGGCLMVHVVYNPSWEGTTLLCVSSAPFNTSYLMQRMLGQTNNFLVLPNSRMSS